MRKTTRNLAVAIGAIVLIAGVGVGAPFLIKGPTIVDEFQEQDEEMRTNPQIAEMRQTIEALREVAEGMRARSETESP